jgi:hypothetical protein
MMPGFAEDRPPSPPSLFDFVAFGAFGPAPLPVREHLRPTGWWPERDAFLVDYRSKSTHRAELELALAVNWEGEA